MRILALCGSLRAASMNAALLRATARLAPAGTSVELFDGLGTLPLYNPDFESAPPDAGRAFRARVAAHDALLVASPEYAHGVTGVIKNALDWLVSFDGIFEKPVAVFNASPQSVHAHAALRETLTTMSAVIVEAACLELPLRGTGIGEQGIVDSPHAAAIRTALAALAAHVVARGAAESD